MYFSGGTSTPISLDTNAGYINIPSLANVVTGITYTYKIAV